MIKVKLKFLLPRLAILALLPILLGLEQLRDPTLPPNVSALAETANNHNMTLNAIFIRPNYRAAIIDGQTFFIGDHIDEYIVTTIEPDAVELVGPDQKHEVIPLAIPVKH